MTGHELVDVTVGKAGTTGRCSCGDTFGPHKPGAGTLPTRHATDRHAVSWTGRSAVEADHRAHAAWQATATAQRKSAAG